MPDEHESAVAAWLDSPDTQQEIEIARRRLILMRSALDPVLCALLIQVVAELSFMHDPILDEPDTPDPDEPWKAA